jgi:hypothetical protein
LNAKLADLYGNTWTHLSGLNALVVAKKTPGHVCDVAHQTLTMPLSRKIIVAKQIVRIAKYHMV